MSQVFYYTMRQFYYKMHQLLQNATTFLRNATLIRNCDNRISTNCDSTNCNRTTMRQLCYYEMRRKFITKYVKPVITKCNSFFVQNATVVTKCDDFITKCNSYYKMRRLLEIVRLHSFCSCSKSRKYINTFVKQINVLSFLSNFASSKNYCWYEFELWKYCFKPRSYLFIY